jgi:calnexin
LLRDFAPPVSGFAEIDDPDDRKPADWVDEPEIEDAAAQKPAGWDEAQPQYLPDPERTEPPADWLPDEPRFIPDPDATMPDTWDPDIHGEWEPATIPNPKCEEAAGCCEYEPPLIDNPNYQGKWYPPRIANPAYKGEWSPRKIPNPFYYEDPHPHNFPELIGAGFELWMVSNTIGFGNVYIGTDEEAVRSWNKVHFLPKWKTQEEERKKNAPTPTMTPPPNSWNFDERKDFHVAFGAFSDGLREAITQLYGASPPMAIVVTIVLAGLPLFLCLSLCREPAQQAPRPRQLTPEEKEERAKRRAERAKARAEKAAAERQTAPPQ